MQNETLILQNLIWNKEWPQLRHVTDIHNVWTHLNKTKSSGKNFWCLLYFKCLHLHNTAS